MDNKTNSVLKREKTIVILLVLSSLFVAVDSAQADLTINERYIPFRIYVYDSKRVVLKHLQIRLYIPIEKFRLKKFDIDQTVFLSRETVIALQKKPFVIAATKQSQKNKARKQK